MQDLWLTSSGQAIHPMPVWKMDIKRWQLMLLLSWFLFLFFSVVMQKQFSELKRISFLGFIAFAIFFQFCRFIESNYWFLKKIHKYCFVRYYIYISNVTDNYIFKCDWFLIITRNTFFFLGQHTWCFKQDQLSTICYYHWPLYYQ